MSTQELQPTKLTHSALSLKLADTVFVAFDTETTGLSPVAAQLVELSGVKFCADGTELSTFQALIKPTSSIPAEVIAIHGITDDMVQSADGCDVVVPDFLNWATVIEPAKPPSPGNQTVLVAHNAPFDIGFIEVALCKLGLAVPENLILDTLPLSRQLLPASPNQKLRTLIEHIGSDATTYHRALADSQHVRNLLLNILKKLPPDATIADLVDICGKLHFMDRSMIDESSAVQLQEFALIKQAIIDGLDLRISYSGVRTTSRVVTPRSVLYTSGKPYLSAFCHLVSAERTFRIDRIVSMERLDR